MKFPLTAHGGVDFRLLLIPANWEQAPKIQHRLDTSIAEGRTTIEERRPARSALLLTQKIRITAVDTDLDDWRKGLAALGAGRVAVPLWVDALPVARWGERIYDPSVVVNFDPDSGAFEIYDAVALPDVPAYPLYAPLLLGRWDKRPPASALSDTVADVDVTIVEASPWSWRIGVNAYGAGWAAVPNWVSPLQDASDYGLELIRLSAAREPGLDRVNAAPRWTQSAQFDFADRLSIRQALAWFVAKHGPWQSWGPLPAWLQPGAPTSGTPDAYTVRFASDALELTFASDECAATSIGFIQEIATPTQPQALPGELYLYRLDYAPDPDHPELFTNWDAPQTLPEGDYVPRQIESQEIIRSLKPQDEKAEIRMEFVEGSLAADWILGRLYGVVKLTIWKADPADLGARKVIFAGLLQEVRPEGNTLTLVAQLGGPLLTRRTPGWHFGPRCNTWVFSPLCGLVEAAFRSAGTIGPGDLASDGVTLTIHGAAGWGGPAYADNLFANGILRTGAGRATMIVSILSSATVGGNLVVKVRRPLWADKIAPGQAVQLVPGCSGQYVSDCGPGKFNNQLNFRGYPFIPDYIETRAAGVPKGPKK